MQLLGDFLENPDDSRLYYRVIKDFRRCYLGLLPKKYWIFPQLPYIYRISNVLCLEFPAKGSYQYRFELSELKRRLSKNFIMNVRYVDDKVIFVLRERR